MAGYHLGPVTPSAADGENWVGLFELLYWMNHYRINIVKYSKADHIGTYFAPKIALMSVFLTHGWH